MSDLEGVKPWPLFGYAPGNYMCECVICNQAFVGDKRAVHCLECAARAVNAAALSPSPVPAPLPGSGWKLVPVEPTEAMLDAHYDAHATADTVFGDARDVWAAMLAAAPANPAETQAVEVGE